MSYYKINKIHEWLYRVSDPRGVHCYLLVGEDKALLYDTAFGLGDLPAEIREITDKPLTVVLGHAHWDHSGGAYLFSEVYLHENDFELCRIHTSPEYREMLFGWSGPLPDGFDKETYLQNGTGNLKSLHVGMIFDLGGLTAEAVMLEGHTKGSVGLLIEQQKVLLVSDAVNGDVWLFLDESTSVREYTAMLKRINELNFEYFYGGHSGEAVAKSNIGKYIRAAENATMEKATLFPHEYRGLKAYEYREGEAGLFFSERTING